MCSENGFKHKPLVDTSTGVCLPEVGLACCPCSQHVWAIVRLSALCSVSEQDERSCQISLEHNGLLCREVCSGPVPSLSLDRTLHLH